MHADDASVYQLTQKVRLLPDEPTQVLRTNTHLSVAEHARLSVLPAAVLHETWSVCARAGTMRLRPPAPLEEVSRPDRIGREAAALLAAGREPQDLVVTDHAALPLPGRRYGVDLPVLTDPAQELAGWGPAANCSVMEDDQPPQRA